MIGTQNEKLREGEEGCSNEIPKLSKKKYEAKLEFPEGWESGAQEITPSWDLGGGGGGMDSCRK